MDLSVSPGGPLQPADRPPAEGEDSPRYLRLPEEGSLSGHDHVAVERKLETSGKACTMDGDDERLAQPSTGETERVVSVVAVFHPLRNGLLEEGEVEAGAVYGAVSEQQGAAQFVILIKGGIGRGEFPHDLGRQRVAFRRPIDSDQHHPITNLEGHSALIGRVDDFPL